MSYVGQISVIQVKLDSTSMNAQLEDIFQTEVMINVRVRVGLGL